ncbi:hypothetical protein N9P74_00275 [bacterium]|nr:hypothetical protein [bacterium]MDB0072689.1 hypothetical protein [bacterium]MDB4351854.1 hypothetical protein [Porticoccaceae bacterium]
MKKGKTAKIPGYKRAKVMYGTVDSVELKSLYLSLHTWVDPKDDNDNWERVVLNMSRSIKHLVLETIKGKLFNKNFIVDFDLRHSGLHKGKKSFLSLEITLFLTDNILDFRDRKIKENLKEIVNNIFKYEFNNNKHFEFHLTKSSNKEKVLTETGIS